jgi:hypothetical protein
VNTKWVSVGMALAACTALASATQAQAYVDNGNGTYSVSTTELQEVFGAGVVVANVAFHVEAGQKWYNVPCKKKNPKKTTTREFKRQTHTEQSMTVAATSTGVLLTPSGTVITDGNTRCPSGWQSDGAITTIAQSKETGIMAVYNGASIELARD